MYKVWLYFLIVTGFALIVVNGFVLTKLVPFYIWLPLALFLGAATGSFYNEAKRL